MSAKFTQDFENRSSTERVNPISETNGQNREEVLEADCRWAMSMLVNGIEGRLVDIHDGDFDKVLKAARRMPAFKRAQAWLEAHPEQGKEQDHDRVTRSLSGSH
jgi:hypothetical protein